MDEQTYDLKPARKAFSRIGLAFSAILVVATVCQLLWIFIPELIWGEENWTNSTSWGMWIGTFAPLYAIAIPIGLLIMRKLPAQRPEENKLTVGKFLLWLPICFCLMYAGNLIGNFLSMLFSWGRAENSLNDYAMDNNPLKIVVMVILAPLLEEFICRKQIIDRTRQYGEKTAILLSALVFGLLHQNLFQFFYAFALGLVFAYIYIRTGRLRYPVLLHSIVNFMGAVVAPAILSLLDMEALANINPAATDAQILAMYKDILPGLLLLMLYSTFLMAISIAGLVLLILKIRKLEWKEAATPLPKGTAAKTVYRNAGMILYIVLCVISIILALL